MRALAGAGQRWDRAGGLIAVGLHVAAISAVLAHEPVRATLAAAAPIMVQLLAANAETKPEPRPIIRPAARPIEKPAVPRLEPEASRVAAAQHEIPAAAPAPPPSARAELAPAPAAVIAAPIFDADYLENPAPGYPALSRRAREQGRVLLHVLVNAAGAADDVQVQASSGFARLDATACETVRRWRFVPAKRGTEAVAAWVLIPITFKLDS